MSTGWRGFDPATVPTAPQRARAAQQHLPSSRDPAVRLLALQRSLGNAGVARLVQRGRATTRPTVANHRLLQRFAGPEHQALGDTLHTLIDLGHGVTLSWGQVLAIAGDEVGTIDELLADPATEEGRHKLGASLINAELTKTAPAALQPTAGQLEAHTKDFKLLALDNADHFPDSGRAIGAWTGHHVAAIDHAVAAGFANHPQGISTAYAYEAFGQHFLTDCFSGGHLRTPRAQIIAWYLHWAEHATDALVEGIIRTVTNELTREADSQTAAPTFMVRRRVEARVRPAVQGAVASEFGGMPKFRRLLGLGVAGAISGTIHDAEGAAGVLVGSDDHAAPWTAYGDGKLTRSPVSFEQASKAIAAAKADIDLAYLMGEEDGAKVTGGSDLDRLTASLAAGARARATLAPPFRSVLKYVPRPMEERGSITYGGNKPVSEWRWGQLGWKFTDAINDYIRSVVGTALRDGVARSKDINDVETTDGITVHPRRALDGLVRDFMQRPIEVVGGLIGEPGYAPSPTPPGATTPPIAPPETGEDPEPDPSVPWP